MRVCGVCFWAWFAHPGDDDGLCVNRPPTVLVVHDADGEVTTLSQRPQIGRQDRGCYYFSHKSERPPGPQPVQRAAGQPGHDDDRS